MIDVLDALRNLSAARADPAAFFTAAVAKGGLQTVHIGPSRVRVLAEPALVHELLSRYPDRISKDTRGGRILKHVMGDSVISAAGGAVWKTHRRRMQPTFKRKSAMAMLPTVRDVCERAVRRVGPDPFELLTLLSTVSVEITGRTLFSDSLARHADDIAFAIDELTRTYGPLNTSLLPVPELQPTRTARRYRNARRILRGLALDVVRQHRATDDLLAALKSELSEQAVVDEVVTLLLAGSETVAVAATWMAVLLTGAPDERARLEATVDTEDTGPLQRATLESLRMRPPAWVMVRKIETELELGGESLFPGDLVFVPIQALQNAAHLWADPDVFRPDRWIDDPRPAAFLAFGDGQRRCLGESLAFHEQMEMISAFQRAGTLTALTDLDSASTGLSTRPLGPVWAQLHRPRGTLS